MSRSLITNQSRSNGVKDAKSFRPCSYSSSSFQIMMLMTLNDPRSATSCSGKTSNWLLPAKDWTPHGRNSGTDQAPVRARRTRSHHPDFSLGTAESIQGLAPRPEFPMACTPVGVGIDGLIDHPSG